MRIVLLYDNFIRDYRGLLLLAEFLKKMGHKVWLKAGWDNPYFFCKTHSIEVLVTGQIGETATYKFGEYSKENNIRLVLNTSEHILAENNFAMTFAYNTTDINTDIIDFQIIALNPVYNFIKSNKQISDSKKDKYKLLGFPRTDISFHWPLRAIEEKKVEEKYKLSKFSKRYLFLSSFLLDGAFDGVPEKDLEKWNIKAFKARTVELLSHTSHILKKFMDEYMTKDDVLLIKKHPWDCSSYFADNFASENCIIIDNAEYITPCIGISDVVIHTHSTASVEAWIMNKPTVAIYLDKYMDVAAYHMKFERVVDNYEKFIEAIESDFVVPNLNSEELFAGTMDGKATFRLAKEIDNLKPFTKKKKWERIRKHQVESLLKYKLFDYGYNKIDPNERAEKNTKFHDFLTWENERSIVNKLYKAKIRKFVKFFLKQNNNE